MNRIEQILIRIYDFKGFKKDFEFCEFYNIKPNTLSTWKKRNKIPYELIEDISQNENISIDFILNGKVQNEPIKSLDTQNETIAINFYPEVYAAAGYGALNGDANPKKIQLSKAFLDEIINIRKYDKLEIIRVYGDSMEPYISNGEFVIIEKNHEAKNGETVIANINGEVYIKRFKADPFKTWIKLQSDNSTYDDIHIEGENLNLIKIIGIVRAKIKPF